MLSGWRGDHVFAAQREISGWFAQHNRRRAQARPVGDLAYPEREGHRRELADIGRQQLETPAHWRESTLQASQWSDHCRAAGYRRIIGVTARELRPRADDYVVRVTESARKTRVTKPSHNIT
jgi:hypothetical protein